MKAAPNNCKKFYSRKDDYGLFAIDMLLENEFKKEKEVLGINKVGITMKKVLCNMYKL
jgi:hypothetical protein